MSGRLDQWLPDRRFGFIDSNGEKFFFHIDGLAAGSSEPARGKLCTFDAVTNSRAGNRFPIANNVWIEVTTGFDLLAGKQE